MVRFRQVSETSDVERMICSVMMWESGCCENVEIGRDRGAIVVLKIAAALRSGSCQHPVIASSQPTITSIVVALAF